MESPACLALPYGSLCWSSSRQGHGPAAQQQADHNRGTERHPPMQSADQGLQRHREAPTCVVSLPSLQVPAPPSPAGQQSLTLQMSPAAGSVQTKLWLQSNRESHQQPTAAAALHAPPAMHSWKSTPSLHCTVGPSNATPAVTTAAVAQR